MIRVILRHIDWALLIPSVILLIISLITLFSLDFSLFRNQLFFSVISILAFIFFAQTNHTVMRIYGPYIYIASLIILFFVLVLGVESRGATRWVEILGIRIQFSEILKPLLAVSFASFLVNRRADFSTLLLTILFLSPIALLIFFQPDLGNALIYAGVVALVLIFFGIPLRFFLAGSLIFAALAPVFWRFLHDYQKNRIITFINPGSDPLGTSYNAIQSVIAVGSGMILGKGLGQGTQSGLRFLPERHTDFIFATISEQLGFIGSVAILACFLFILYRVFFIFYNSNDQFTKMLSVISFFLILVQFFANVGMNVGLLPVVGITLPFVSYGGSSLLSSFILLGLLSGARATKEEGVLEIG